MYIENACFLICMLLSISRMHIQHLLVPHVTSCPFQGLSTDSGLSPPTNGGSFIGSPKELDKFPMFAVSLKSGSVGIFKCKMQPIFPVFQWSTFQMSGAGTFDLHWNESYTFPNLVFQSLQLISLVWKTQWHSQWNNVFCSWSSNEFILIEIKWHLTF